MRKELRDKIKKEEESKDEEVEEKKQITKEQAYAVWDLLLKDVPEDYDFVITTQNECFPKGS
jgi:hypothetical protein